MTQAYHFRAADHCFVIEQYNDLSPLAGFLPGIAGTMGRPAWVFYVNRGQAIASFGVRNKDGAFLEFYPADKAYQLTQSRGFRTFLKIHDGERIHTYEPFQRGAGANVSQRLSVAAHEVSVEEDNSPLEFSIRADISTLPEAPVAALLRRVIIVNHSTRARKIEIADGLPQVLPFGLNQWGVKFMSRTSEAFMRVEGVTENLPFYRLKVFPTDTPQVEPVIAGNFFVGFLNGKRTQVLVDPERIFGLAGDFSKPEGFFNNTALDFEQQVSANQTPSAFQAITLELEPGASQVFYGLYGHARSLPELEQFLATITLDDYFEQKREQNQRLVAEITQKAFTATAKPLFDAHVQQCYLDNGLRGGFPTQVPGNLYLYLFGRKHGDLERDYNDFLLQDTCFSEGNGDFRDVLQNRRLDLFFTPSLGDNTIRYFFNLIQPDGYNPCSLRNSRFIVETPQQFSQYFDHFNGLEALLAREFKYAELWQVLQGATENPTSIITEILQHAQSIEDAEFDRGYWSDHWTYLVDLLHSFAAIFPDRLTDLFNAKTYSFFDPTHIVLPRALKYQLTPSGVRQFGAVQFRPDKKALIESRPARRYQVRAQKGHGAIVYTTLLGKILTLISNKFATLDPFGVGIEMEADRPGWCDALNGLPGILGSSVNETIELKRLVYFTEQVVIELTQAPSLPIELAEFILSLDALLTQAELSAEQFWQASGAHKEVYREQIFMGFDGAEQCLPIVDIQNFLAKVSVYLDGAIAKARTPKGIITYFAYQAEHYQSHPNGQITVTRFRQQPLPLFLEGFVHALRIAELNDALVLYEAVQRSELFDQKLGMYRLNAPLGEHALEFGRIGVFNYGWLENGSIFQHMHYKMVLEIVRAGLVEEFYAQMDKLLVAFRDPLEYRRSPIENSSFLVSSGFAIDPRQHGRGCVARLSGATVELLHLWTLLFLGPKPFTFEAEKLCFKPKPLLSKTLFTIAEQAITFLANTENLPADSIACAFLGDTLLVYINPTRHNTFGADAVKPCRFILYGRDGREQSIDAFHLEGSTAEALRLGKYRRIDIVLGR